MHPSPIFTVTSIHTIRAGCSHGLDPEVEVDEGEHQALEVLDQIEEDGQAVGVLALLHLGIGADLGCLEGEGLPVYVDLQQLLAGLVGLRPQRVALLQDLAVRNDLLDLFQHSVGNVH